MIKALSTLRLARAEHAMSVPKGAVRIQTLDVTTVILWKDC
jgi:hypothetical protein